MSLSPVCLQFEFRKEKMSNSNQTQDRKLLILYGSETGTAQEVAERIGRESYLRHFHSVVSCMNDCTLDQLKSEKLVILVAATTGQGDDPDNMKQFFQSLWNKRNEKSILEGVQYGVLGLGDSSYQKFNFSSKRLNKLFQLLGASAILDIGLADDQHDLGPDFVIDHWLKELWNRLLQLHPLPNDIQPLTENYLPPPKFKIQFIESLVENKIVQPKDNKVFVGTITANVRKTSNDHFQDVRLIEFDIGSSVLHYNPGDVVMIQPQNRKEYVDEFITTLGLDETRVFYIVPNKNEKLPPEHMLPQPCTIRRCVESYFDIQSIPRRYFFELLSQFTKSELEKEKFLEFASPEGQEELYNYCHRPKRSIFEVLADFPETKTNIPFEYLFNLIPPIRPRAFSIASSLTAFPGRLQILLSIVHYKTILKRPRLGLCTNWLAHLDPGSRVPLWIKAGTLNFPDAASKCPPVIMIGPGTGCAPFRSYIQERVASHNTQDLVMVFGCRGREKDYFFKEEWETLSKKGDLTLFCAFSRDQEEKIYVQHVMKENYAALWKHIGDRNARIYYAGNAKRTPIDVYEALEYICRKSLNLSDKEVEQFMKRNIDKRYQTESWA